MRSFFKYILIFILPISVSAQIKIKYTYQYDYYGLDKTTKAIDTVLTKPMNFWEVSKIFWFGIKTPKYYFYTDSAAQYEIDYYEEFAGKGKSKFVHIGSIEDFLNERDSTRYSIKIMRSKNGYAYPFHALEEFTFDSLKRITHYYCNNHTPEGDNPDEEYSFLYGIYGAVSYIFEPLKLQNNITILYDEKGRLKEVISFSDDARVIWKYKLTAEYE